MKAFITVLTITMMACVLTGCATEYHVSTAGLDENSSTQSEPLKTIPATVGVSAANDKNTPTDAANGFVWKSVIPEDCPFERSKTLTGIFFTGRHSDYCCGDTFYPSWASDGNIVKLVGKLKP